MESRQDTFQSTPSAWRETHGILFCGNCGHHFNPLPPHGGRHYNREELIFLETFQSTPSAWRETTASSPKSSHMVPFQSTPSAWRETCISGENSNKNIISIHSLRMEGDPVVCVVSLGTIISIHSLRMEGDALHPFSCWSVSISIHSLRMEGDRRTDQNGPP